jgi:regulator of replication initiation timing
VKNNRVPYYFLWIVHSLKGYFMTDHSLQKLEEKIMALLATLAELRAEANQLKQENTAFKMEKINYTKRLQDLIALLDSVDSLEENKLRQTSALEELPELEEFSLI